MFIAALFTIPKIWKESITHIHIHIYTYIHRTECYLILKDKKILSFATTRMNIENIILSEIATHRKIKDLTYMWEGSKKIELIEADCRSWLLVVWGIGDIRNAG
jgi:hypothetical protein